MITWIDVNDRLPNPIGRVLIWQEGDGPWKPTAEFRDFRGLRLDLDYFVRNRITYWSEINSPSGGTEAPWLAGEAL